MKLYFSPGSCSLSPHIALREAGVAFELEQVDLAAKKVKKGEADYLAINGKGYVPALLLDDGKLLTEGAVIVQYIADLNPAAQLAPPVGTFERLRLQEWLNFIATELHKTFGPINNPKSSDEFRQIWKQRLALRFAFLAKGLEGKPFLLGQHYSVADGYAYYVLRNWNKLDRAALAESQVLASYFDRLSSRPAVRAALTAEGLS